MPIVLSRKTGLRLKPCSRPQQHNPKTNRCKKMSAKKSSRKSGKKSARKSAKKSSRKSGKKSARKSARKSTAMVLYKRH